VAGKAGIAPGSDRSIALRVGSPISLLEKLIFGDTIVGTHMKSTVATEAKNITKEDRAAISGIFTKEYYEQTYGNGVSYASHLMLRLFRDTGVLSLLKAGGASTEEIIAKCNFIPQSRYALEWILEFLAQTGFLKLKEDKSNKRYLLDWDGRIEPEVYLEKGLALDKKILPTSNLMEYVLSEYPDFLKGSKKGFEIIFAQDKMHFWNDYFSNDNSSYRAYNYFGAFGVAKWLPKAGGVRLLEVGGGTGGASAALIDTLKANNRLSQISEYIFSDVSPAFLRLGNRAIMQNTGEDFNYSLKRLDFEKPLAGQGIKKDYLDVVYGVNTLHVAKDLVGALRNIGEVLKPGGVLVLCEYCRPSMNYFLLQEFIFNMLDNFVNVNLNPELRPLPGFLDYPHWKKNLEAAGYTNIEAIFNSDGAYPAQERLKIDVLAVVIKAEKSF
jgi:SAM-dependent methyltransferase